MTFDPRTGLPVAYPTPYPQQPVGGQGIMGASAGIEGTLGSLPTATVPGAPPVQGLPAMPGAPIDPNAPVVGPAGPVAPPADPAGLGGYLTQVQDENQASLQEISQKLGELQGQIDQALKDNNIALARQLVTTGIDLASRGRMLSSDPQLNAFFAQAEQALTSASGELDKAAAELKEAEGEAKPAEEKKEHKGPFGFIGKAVDAVGGVIEGAARIVTAPLELVGKVLDPIRETVGGVLGGLKDTIDNTLGKIPVLGSAVRFTTGLASSVVGLVDGTLQAVTHPVDTLKALGSVAWKLSGVIPPFINAKTIYDMGVNGMNPMESFQDSVGGVTDLGKAFFSGALEDISKGNYAGALGRVTGDIGSFFVTGGAAGAGKAGATAAKVAQATGWAKAGAKAGELAAAAGRTGKVAELTQAAGKLGAVQKAGALATRFHLDDFGRAYAGQAVRATELGVTASTKILQYAGRVQGPWMKFLDNWAQKLPGVSRVYSPARAAVVNRATPYVERLNATLDARAAQVNGHVGLPVTSATPIRVAKRPIPTPAEQLLEARTIQTLEGPVKANAGDWLMTGVKGEQWPIPPEKFAATYESVASHPGHYAKKTVPVEAVTLDAPMTVKTSWGAELQGKPGDWLVSAGPNDRWIVDPDVFQQTYALHP